LRLGDLGHARPGPLRRPDLRGRVPGDGPGDSPAPVRLGLRRGSGAHRGAVPLHLGAEHRDALPWTFAAFVLYLLSFVFTVRVNIPLNNALQAAGDVDGIDAGEARARFDEVKWNRWHGVRTALCVAALVCMVVALTV